MLTASAVDYGVNETKIELMDRISSRYSSMMTSGIAILNWFVAVSHEMTRAAWMRAVFSGARPLFFPTRFFPANAGNGSAGVSSNVVPFRLKHASTM